MLGPCKCEMINAESYAFRIPLLNTVPFLTWSLAQYRSVYLERSSCHPSTPSVVSVLRELSLYEEVSNASRKDRDRRGKVLTLFLGDIIKVYLT